MYHSALKRFKYLDTPIGVDRFELLGSVAFTHDISVSIPEEYKTADILYSELPFGTGMRVFNARAGANCDRQYLLKSVAAMPFILNKPAIFTASKIDKSIFKDYQSINTLQNGDPVTAYFCGINPSNQWATTGGILNDISLKYGVVGDCCCGYGGAGIKFLLSGGRFVMSDYNPKCIYVVQQIIKDILSHENLSQ